jgi:hypothetical protein
MEYFNIDVTLYGIPEHFSKGLITFTYSFTTCDQLLYLGGSFLQFCLAEAVTAYVRFCHPYIEELRLWCYDISFDF